MKVHKKVLALSVSIMVFSASLCFGVLLIDNTNYEKASVVTVSYTHLTLPTMATV